MNNSTGCITKENRNSKNFYARITAALVAVLLFLVMTFASVSQAFAYEKIEVKDETPTVTAQAVIVYSEDLGKVIYSKNESKRMNPYSITKLMTAYIAAQNLDLDEKVTITGAGTKAEESTMKLKDGEVLTVKELLQGLLIESGNDAARVLAVKVAGSEKAFAEMMNEQAEEWGCKNTHFANASGMQDKNHYTTAEDYLIIGRKALEDETVREISFSKKVKIPATSKSEERVYKNHTTLVQTKGSGVLGGKTGFWDDDDCSVVLEYFKKDMRLTMVILGDTKKERSEDVKTLARNAHDTVPGFVLAKTNEVAAKLWVKGGAKTRIPVYVDETAYAYPASGKEKDIDVKASLDKGIKAPIKAGQHIGKYEIYVKGELKATHDLVVKDDVEKGWILSNIYISNTASLCIFIVILLIAFLIFILRRINKRRRRAKRRRRERERQEAMARAREREMAMERSRFDNRL